MQWRWCAATADRSRIDAKMRTCASGAATARNGCVDDAKETTCARARQEVGEDDVDGMDTQGWDDTHVAWWMRWFGDAGAKKKERKRDT